MPEDSTLPPPPEEIEEVIHHCTSNISSGDSLFPGLTYEDGVVAALLWIKGDSENPMEG